MEVTLTATTEAKTPNKEPLKARHIKQWVSALPDDAQIIAITYDRGSQREPDRILIGLRATWTETRQAPREVAGTWRD